MLFPVKEPYRISSNYGNRSSGFHNGIDIAVPINTPIFAPLPGVVVASYSNAKGGNQMIIEHANAIKTGYAHLNTRLQIGDQVNKGDIIALSGNTGQTTGAHLHFTTRKNGELTDPLRFNYLDKVNEFNKITKFSKSTALIGGFGLILLSAGIYYYNKTR